MEKYVNNKHYKCADWLLMFVAGVYHHMSIKGARESFFKIHHAALCLTVQCSLVILLVQVLSHMPKGFVVVVVCLFCFLAI